MAMGMRKGKGEGPVRSNGRMSMREYNVQRASGGSGRKQWPAWAPFGGLVPALVWLFRGSDGALEIGL